MFNISKEWVEAMTQIAELEERVGGSFSWN